ncbi:hypothetical protein I302_105179 [Kwoniella bestiolae CBS 10118]|uniref:Uncharacterized protein n=1 Tax=Kwoniella bestiolae CBS 10118 TaxID=1296100 RepID=A0A1B9FSE1_9TREE|nr:hypothetical protein I302_08466 [Kwoniella bestiolae CBS 10118]OCF21689.1 hypothetical protein I302_08466 [Kwoniella bestiolae CBS 10118]
MSGNFLDNKLDFMLVNKDTCVAVGPILYASIFNFDKPLRDAHIQDAGRKLVGALEGSHKKVSKRSPFGSYSRIAFLAGIRSMALDLGADTAMDRKEKDDVMSSICHPRFFCWTYDSPASDFLYRGRIGDLSFQSDSALPEIAAHHVYDDVIPVLGTLNRVEFLSAPYGTYSPESWISRINKIIRRSLVVEKNARLRNAARINELAEMNRRRKATTWEFCGIDRYIVLKEEMTIEDELKRLENRVIECIPEMVGKVKLVSEKEGRGCEVCEVCWNVY